MGTCTRGGKDKFALIDSVNQKPVWLYMAFTLTSIVACQRMVVVFWGKWLFFYKRLQHIIQKLYGQPLLDNAPSVFPVLRGRLEA